MSSFSILAGLFAAAFAAATIFPVQSEALFAGLLAGTDISPWLLLAVASVGNILGSCLNWMLGRSLETFRDRRWFPASAQALAKAQDRYTRHGRWLLLLSWVPVIGDPITIIAGVMREKFLVFLALVSIAKIGRYAVLMVGVLISMG